MCHQRRAQRTLFSMIRVCFVCLGNICRSPTAEGIFRGLVEQAGLTDELVIDSAGTSGWHLNEAPDERATDAAAERGYELSGGSRQFTASDFDRFDYVIAMDSENVADLGDICRDGGDRKKIALLRDHDADAVGEDVPDPFYGGGGGFQEVLDICERGCQGLLESIRKEHGLA